MKIQQVLEALEQFASLPLQESWDNAGLQVGLTGAEVSGALLCLDVNEQIIDEAISKGCNLVVSHHPLLFRGLKQIAGADYVQRTVMKAIEHHIVILSMHTNMDNVRGGVNWKMAERLGLSDVRFLQPADGKDAETAGAGSGAMGEWPEAMDARDFVSLVKQQFSVQCACCNALLNRPIRRVALCGGAGDFLLDEAIAQRADAFITGEMHYHQYFGHEQQLQICVIGHWQSEQFTGEIFREILQQQCPSVKTFLTETNTNPIKYL